MRLERPEAPARTLAPDGGEPARETRARSRRARAEEDRRVDAREVRPMRSASRNQPDADLDEHDRAAPGQRSPGRVRPSVSSAEPLSKTTERIDTCSTPQNTNMKPTSVSVSQGRDKHQRMSAERRVPRETAVAFPEATGRVVCERAEHVLDVQEDPARDERDAGAWEHDRLDRRRERRSQTSDKPNATATTRSTISTRPIFPELSPRPVTTPRR